MLNVVYFYTEKNKSQIMKKLLFCSEMQNQDAVRQNQDGVYVYYVLSLFCVTINIWMRINP